MLPSSLCNGGCGDTYPKKNRIIYPETPSDRSERCWKQPDSCSFTEQEHNQPYCDTQPIDMSFIRYNIATCDNPKKKPTGIERGTRLDIIIEDFKQAVDNYEFFQSPVVPGKPQIKTMQAVIMDLYHELALAKEEIENLKKQIDVES